MAEPSGKAPEGDGEEEVSCDEALLAALQKLKKGDKVVITIAGEGYNTVTKKITVKGVYKLSKVKAKKGAKKITGTVSAKKAKVQVKVGMNKYKKAKVKGKKKQAVIFRLGELQSAEKTVNQRATGDPFYFKYITIKAMGLIFPMALLLCLN